MYCENCGLLLIEWYRKVSFRFFRLDIVCPVCYHTSTLGEMSTEGADMDGLRWDAAIDEDTKNAIHGAAARIALASIYVDTGMKGGPVVTPEDRALVALRDIIIKQYAAVAACIHSNELSQKTLLSLFTASDPTA